MSSTCINFNYKIRKLKMREIKKKVFPIYKHLQGPNK